MEIKTILELADKAGFNASELEKGFANLLRQRLIDFANLVEAHDRLAQPKKKWVGLEDEDVATVKNEFNRGALWAEQVLRNKNT